VVNACVTDISFGKFVVHGCDCRECGQFVFTVPQNLDHVFMGKRMWETHLMVTSVLLCTPNSSVPAEVSKWLLFC
jgi:hypothetical protein